MKSFSKAKILVIGDISVDKYIFGKSVGISFEAPIPIVKVNSMMLKMGQSGVIMENAALLGAQVLAIGLSGDDEAGQWLRDNFRKLGINSKYFSLIKSFKTMIRTRVFSDNHHVSRFDESPSKLSNNLIEKITKNLQQTIPNVNLIVICDYGNNMINDVILSTIKKLALIYKKKILVSPSENHLKYADPNFVYRITIKDAEKLLDTRFGDCKSTEDICHKLESLLKSKKIILTRGENGLTAYENNTAHDITATHHKARDITSVGDILTATFAASYASGNSFLESCTIANIAAGIAVEKIGTKLVELKEIRKELDQYDDWTFGK
jgi:rfaE bifunctional protein kinase chain/domain